MISLLKILFFFGLILIAKSQETSLEYLIILFRHGSRAPTRIYPTNPNKETYWLNYGGLGQITPKGMKQLYDLGEYIKDYYKEFLPNVYDRKKIYARSTDVDRTLISASSFLSGLYKTNQDLRWNNISGLYDWLPVPIHTIPIDNDPLYNFNSPCPMYDYYRNLSLESQEYLDLSLKNKEFIDKISSLSGVKDLDYYKMWIISDDTNNELIEGLNVPGWVTENYENIKNAKDYGYTLDYGSIEKAKFYGGNLLNEILNNMNKKINGKMSYDLSIYSTHDTYLSGLYSLLNFTWPLKEIPYGSGIVFELRKDSNMNHYIKILYTNNWFNEPIKLNEAQINECTNLCPYSSFLNLTSNKFIKDFKKECLFHQDNNMANFKHNLKILINILFAYIVFKLIKIVFV